MSLQPLVTVIRFGFTPRGSPPSGGPTDFRHEFHYLSFAHQAIRFGRQPVGTSGGTAAAKPRNHPFFATPGQMMHR